MMTNESEALKQDLHERIQELKKLGAEIRGDLRAAGVNARKEWNQFLEPQIENVEKLAKEIGAASHDAIERTKNAFGDFQRSLKPAPAKKLVRKPRRKMAAAKRAH